MRKLMLLDNATLDGHLARRSDTNAAVLMPVVAEQFDWQADLLDDYDTLLIGRVSYEKAATFWPHHSSRLADRLNDMTKVVFSSTLNRLVWANSRLASRDPADELAHLRTQPGRNICVKGSPMLAQTLSRQRLIDEYVLILHPLIAGGTVSRTSTTRTTCPRCGSSTSPNWPPTQSLSPMSEPDPILRRGSRGAGSVGTIKPLEPDEFVELTSPWRRELLAHCYRMTGSVYDAEDLVQETMLRAWRNYDAFEQRASVRTWLYRIATNVCLNALERGPGRRVLPAGLGIATNDADQPLRLAGAEVAWLQPVPDRMLTERDDPAAVVIARETIRLAFIAALQYLPPRQRAILILRDVLAWPAADVARLLETTTTAVNSALLRARHAIAVAESGISELPEPDDPVVAALLDRYVAAFERADMDELTDLLCTDAQVQMPPHLTWFAGRDTIGRFFAGRVREPGQVRLVATRANGQPAAAVYLRTGDGTYRANSIHVLGVRDNQVHTIVAFLDPTLLDLFDPTKGRSSR